MIVLALIGGLFMADNQEYFGQAERQIEQGYQWQYVGKQSPSDKAFSLTVADKDGKPTIYFKLTKGQE